MTSSGKSIGDFFIHIWNFFRVLFIALKWSLVETCTKHRKTNLQTIPKKTGQFAIVTGGARGIGAEVVKQLLSLDMNVIIGCRSEASGIAFVEQIRREGIEGGNVEVLQLDLNCLDSVRRFAKTLLDRDIPIHILINNAGVMFVPYQLTEDGLESHFQTNYLGHFLLTSLLTPLLITGGYTDRVSRVINVSSIAHFGGKINFSNRAMDSYDFYDQYMAYMSTKLMQVVSAKDLNARFKADGSPVRVYSLHPGVVWTELYNNLWYIQAFKCFLKLFFRTPLEGAVGVIYVAISPEVETEGGEYFMNCKKQTPNHLATDPSVRQKLWNTSMSLVGLKSSLKNDEPEVIVMN